MKRFFAIGGVALILALVAWLVWGGGGGESTAGSPRTKSGAPQLRWSGGGERRQGDDDAPRTEPGAVAGRVIDAIDGRPIAGATVTLRSAGGEELDETSSDEDGAFSFEESGGAEVVVAAAPGYAMRAKDVGDEAIVLELDGAVTVSGIVVDPGGDPVGDAEVWIEDRERSFFRPPTVSSTVRTNAEGRFAVEDAPSGTLIAHADHPDFAKGILELGGLGPGRQKEGVRIEMNDTGALSGRVATEDGSPLARAVVTWIPEERRRRWQRTADEVSVTAGADGRYRFPHLPSGEGLVRAQGGGADGATETKIVLGSEVSADVVAHALPLFTGTVVDGTGTPVAGAAVSPGRGTLGGSRDDALGRIQLRWSEPWGADTDEHGNFSFHAPADGAITLLARTSTATGNQVASPGEPVVIHLSALGIARVRVLGGDGKPYLGEARVEVDSTREGGELWSTMRELENGTVRIEGDAGEWRVRVRVGEDGDEGDDDDDDDDRAPPAVVTGGTVKARIAPAPPETEVIVRVSATLPARSTVRGRVVGSDGAAIVGARISVMADARDWGGSTGARLDWTGAVRSDATGRFALGVPPGTQKLFVYHPEFRSEIATVVVPTQGEGDAGVIHLETGTGASAVYEFSGIGAVLSVDDAGRCVIEEVIAGGPAQRAGVRAKDVLLEVDGVALHGMNLSDVIGRIRGPVGTTVTLRIERAGNLESFLVDVVRDKIRA